MTYTLLVADPHHQLLGIATASKSLAVGRSVPALDPTYGAVASQAYTNRALRHHMLAALRAGNAPQQAIAQIPHLDPDFAYRQVTVIDAAGEAAAHTGEHVTEWAGHRIGDGWVLSGNYLAGPEVLDAMEDRLTRHTHAAAMWDDPAHALARRIAAALAAGEDAGGDARGKQSASLMVASTQEAAHFPPELAVDLRVDDHVEPVKHLQTLVDLQAAES